METVKTIYIVYLNTKTVPIEIKSAVMTTVEFTRIQFQTKAVSGATYMNTLRIRYKKVTKMLPDLKKLVLVGTIINLPLIVLMLQPASENKQRENYCKPLENPR